jgi:hypothetical protein
MKKLLIIGLSAGALYLLYKAYIKKDKKPVEPKAEDKVEVKPITCLEGEIICPTNINVCYNPTAKYLIDPCSAKK